MEPGNDELSNIQAENNPAANKEETLVTREPADDARDSDVAEPATESEVMPELQDENMTTAAPEYPVDNTPADPSKDEELNEFAPLEEPVSEEAALDTLTNVTVPEEAASAEAVSEEPHEEEPAHEEEHHEEELHEEEDIDFEGYGKADLLKFVNEAIAHPDGRNINKKVQQARGEFNRIVREERAAAVEAWKEEGHEESEYVPTEDPMLAEFNAAFKTYKKKRLEYINTLNIQKEENLRIKKEILERLKELTEHPETGDSFTEFKKLQEQWRKIGHVPITEAENIWNTYNYFVDRFYEQRSLYSEFKELDRKRNLTAKEELVNKIEGLLQMEDMSEAMRMLRQYQEEWRHIGPVPKENLEAVIQRYKNAVIQLYEKREKLSEELQQRREQNHDAKVALLEKIEEIAAFESPRVQDWINKNQELGQWIENWRSIGSVPMSKSAELKERFSTAIRLFNKNKNEFFRGRKKEKVDNLKRKIELCERVESLLEVEQPNAHKKEVIKLQDDWKKVGPVPAKYSDKVWKRFQTACDAFFAKLTSQFSEQDKQQHENLAQKNAIIEKIEALTAQEDPIEDANKQIRALQDEFNRIGFVPFKEKDKVRKRFYDALNKLVAKVRGAGGGGAGDDLGDTNDLSTYQLTIETWAQGGDRRLDQEKRKQQHELKRIENEISTLENNMEFFRNSKNADALKGNLERQIAELREKMKGLKDKLNIIRKVGA